MSEFISIWVALNIVTFLIYGLDKYRARRNQFRISEKMLLLFAILGGGVGASMAMNVFRHKTQHKIFTVGVPLSIIFNFVSYGYVAQVLKLL